MNLFNRLYRNIDIYLMWIIAIILTLIILYQIIYNIYYYATDGPIVDKINLL